MFLPQTFLLTFFLLISVSSDGGNAVNTKALVKGSALAILDLDGLD